MKKTLLTICLSAIALSACTSKTMTINGTVADSTQNGNMVYLTDLVSDSIIDSTTVVDSKFTFNRNVDSLYILTLDLGRTGATVLVEVGTVNVELGQPSITKGTPLNDMFFEYNAASDSLQNDAMGLYQSLTAAKEGLQGQDPVAADKAFDEAIEKLSKDYRASEKALTAKYLTGNENNSLGILIQLNDLLGNYQYELPQIDSALAIYSPVIAKIARVKSMRDAALARQNTSAGDMFVNFTGVAADGAAVQLSDFVGKGNYVLLDFWASWCGPCRQAIPSIKEVYAKYKDQGFVVVGANVWDKKDAFEKAMTEMSIPWPQICNFDNKVPTNLYGVMGIPQIILFAPDGTIVARDLHGEDMAAAVAKAYTK